STYDHRVWKTGLPVRSAVLKPHAGRLVVGWVTTSESLLLYVFYFFSMLSCHSVDSLQTKKFLVICRRRKNKADRGENCTRCSELYVPFPKTELVGSVG
ncbi:hypothetical protein BO79DRAFT_161873, partial [Aspergillus costaricaensis CBS 115574]